MRRETRIACTSHSLLLCGVLTEFLKPSRQLFADALGVVVSVVVVSLGSHDGTQSKIGRQSSQVGSERLLILNKR